MRPLSENVFDLPEMREKIHVFADRNHAGEILGEMLLSFQGSNALLLGIPAGGLPVAAVIQKKIGIELDVAVVSKITLPWDTEAGYGAVGDQTYAPVAEQLIKQLAMTQQATLDKNRIASIYRLRIEGDVNGRLGCIQFTGLVRVSR